MRSRTSILAAAAAALAVFLLVWLLDRDSGDEAERLGLERDGSGQLLLKDRPLPRAIHRGGADRGGGGGRDLPHLLPGSDAERANAREAALEARRAANRAARAKPIRRRESETTEQNVDLAEKVPDEMPGGAPPDQVMPTLPPGSIYDGLSQDDLVELMVALRRLRDAGVFLKLTPEQYRDVNTLLPELLGVQDAEKITQEILGMSAGEWLDHERGPKGRFSLR